MTKAWRAFFAATLLAVLLAGGCSRGRPQRPAAPQTGTPADAAPAAAPATPATEKDKPRTAITLEKAEPAAGRPPARPVSEKTPLLSLERDGRLMPDDFRIGPLQDTLQAAGPSLAAARVLERFLGGLARGKVDPQYIEPEGREELTRSLGWYLEGGFVPDRFRIGRIEREEEETRCRVRLFRGESSTEGEVYLSESGGTWYIADVQIGLDLLGESPEPRGERFVPPDPGSSPAP